MEQTDDEGKWMCVNKRVNMLKMKTKLVLAAGWWYELGTDEIFHIFADNNNFHDKNQQLLELCEM